MGKKNLTYKEAILEIEETLAKIENESVDIDELAEMVRRATFLISFCREKLHTTEKEVERILKGMDDKK